MVYLRSIAVGSLFNVGFWGRTPGLYSSHIRHPPIYALQGTTADLGLIGLNDSQARFCDVKQSALSLGLGANHRQLRMYN